MSQLFKIKAKIKINTKGGRTLPFTTGYRPGFVFIKNKQTSGSINLLEKEELSPGEQSVVEIYFVSNVLLGEIKSSTMFKFYEGPCEIGEGIVLEVIG
jgi:translation elongation factor EF-Tu-like GTPase